MTTTAPTTTGAVDTHPAHPATGPDHTVQTVQEPDGAWQVRDYDGRGGCRVVVCRTHQEARTTAYAVVARIEGAA